MKCSFGLALALACVASSADAQQPPPAGGQRAGGPPPMSNLQIIPKDTPREQVITQMQNIAAALGVQCNYCHVQEGRGGRNDFATDEKPPKKAARGMMLLAREINGKMPEAVGKAADATTRVGCATCHHGLPIPKQITDIVAEAAASGGATAGLAKYKELRDKFYGSGAYDFSENSLLMVAQRANAASKADDALTYLQSNLEYNPKSSRSYLMMSLIHNGKGDKASAIKDLEKAIELDPNNAQAKAQLQQLKAQ
jgi:tetratricopeptide (TPR) repeat protein